MIFITFTSLAHLFHYLPFIVVSSYVVIFQMNGPEFTIQKLLEVTKIEQPKSLVIGSHHYVQIAEMDLNITGLRKQDLSSVFSIMPVGTSVPEGLFQKLQSKFPNLIVSFIDISFCIHA